VRRPPRGEPGIGKQSPRVPTIDFGKAIDIRWLSPLMDSALPPRSALCDVACAEPALAAFQKTAETNLFLTTAKFETYQTVTLASHRGKAPPSIPIPTLLRAV
jgi:hypothetical protein